jgi:hypothetical protein
MRLKTGKDEIVYLLTKVVARYEAGTGQGIKLNTNRKNYEALARLLSEISNRLPETSDVLEHEIYLPDENALADAYPHRKYDITGGQVKDAINGIVNKPRPFLVDACYIFLYGVGRKGFAKKPTDENLVDEPVNANVEASQLINITTDPVPAKATNKQKKYWMATFAISALAFAILIIYGAIQNNKQKKLLHDLSIVPYQPTSAEIDSLEGIWLCYTGSPQARTYDTNRYHKIISNIADVKYKGGYFTFIRYGSHFEHVGYMQYESPGLVSIHSHVMNNKDKIESPKLSLMQLNEGKSLISVISASWNFDEGYKNQIIGIREVFIKQGSGGQIEEIINTPQNAACNCKIIKWHKTGGDVKTFYLKNELLDTLHNEQLKVLLDEKSILPKEPGDWHRLLMDSAMVAKPF